MVLVDSSAWIDFFNNEDSPHAVQIKALLVERLVATNKLIMAEILAGAKNKNSFEVLLKNFHQLEIFSIEDSVYNLIIELNYKSMRKGYKIPITDWIIAVNAHNNNAVIYSHDKHFKLIQKFLDIILFNQDENFKGLR